ncbi:MAG: hypothetical protein ABI597_13930 [Gammaproteobacteria bacterium]
MKSKKKTKKITVRFSERLKMEMQQSIINSNYGLHGKSRWLGEAIDLFLAQQNYVELVEHGIDINQADLSEVEAFYLNEDTIEAVKKALTSVRVKYPLFEGVQSAFIRACVTFRLMLRK